MKKTIRLGFTDTFGTAIGFFTEVLSKKWNIIRNDETPDYLIFGDGNFGLNHRDEKYKNSKKIFYTGENVRPNYNECDVAITFDHENSPRHFRLPLYVPEMWMMKNEGVVDRFDYLIKKPIDLDFEWSRKSREYSFIQSNPNCKFRIDFVCAFGKNVVDCGGPLLNNVGKVIPRNIKDTIEFYSTRKFNIAFENSSHPGYCTEKILNAYYANTIPIYWGSPTVTRDFNPNSFILVDDYVKNGKLDFYALRARVDGLMTNEKAYKEMLKEPAFVGDRLNEFCYNENLIEFFERSVI